MTAMFENALAMKAQGGDGRAREELLHLLRGFSQAQVRQKWFPPPGYEWEDLDQIALMALNEAINSWNRCGAIVGFASVVIYRRIAETVRTATRDKHLALNDRVPIDTLTESGDVPFEDRRADVVSLIGWRQESKRIAQELTVLSDLEREALLGTVSDEDYIATAARLNVSVKQIDNAITRARRKLTRVNERIAS